MKTKKTLSLLLAVALVASFVTVPALAAAPTRDDNGVPTNMEAVTEDHGILDLSTEEKAVFVVTGGDIVIDFDQELIYWATGKKPADEAKIPAFFTTDGTKWNAMKFTIADDAAAAKTAGPSKDFQKVLDKGAAKLQFTTAIDKKTKAPQKEVKESAAGAGDGIAAATTYTWGAINARPKINSFKPDYAPASLKTLNAESIAKGGNGVWLPVDSKGEQKAANLQIAYSLDGKAPVVGYGRIDVAAGIKVQGYDEKPGKVNYLIRIAPTAKSAGSKPKKLSVSTVTKAPALKVDYKKENIKFKPDMVYGTITLLTQDQVDKGVLAGNAVVTASNPLVPLAIKDFVQVSTKVTAKGDTLTTAGLALSSATTAVADKTVLYGKDYGVRTVNTEKKPASKVQPISVAALGSPYESDAALTVKGTSISVAKAYEIYDAAKKKWGASVKADKAGTYEVRLKNSAKFDAKTNTTSGSPSSGSMFLGVVIGKDGKGKDLAIATYVADNGAASNPIATASKAKRAVYVKAADKVQEIKIAYVTPAVDIIKTVTPALAAGSAAANYGILVDGMPSDVSTATKVEWASGSVKLTIAAADIDKFTENCTITVTFEDAATAPNDKDEKFYGASIAFNIAVDNSSFVKEAETKIKAAVTPSTTGLDASTIDTAVKAAAAVNSLLSNGVKCGCTTTVTIEDFVAPTMEATGSYKVVIDIERGDKSATVTVTGFVINKKTV